MLAGRVPAPALVSPFDYHEREFKGET